MVLINKTNQLGICYKIYKKNWPLSIPVGKTEAHYVRSLFRETLLHRNSVVKYFAQHNSLLS